MSFKSFLLLGAAWLCAASTALAHEYTVGPLKIGHPWARPTHAGQMVGGAYFSVRNTGTVADRLLSAHSRVAESVEMHEMRMDASQVMRMRELSALPIAAGATVTLEPGGYHLMLMGLKAPLKVGDQVPLVLRFEKAGTVNVVLHVEQAPAGASAPAHKH